MLLNSIPGLGPITLGHLLDSFDQDPWAILQADESKLRQASGVGKSLVVAINQALSSDWLSKEKEKLSKLGGRFLSPDRLPEPLLQIHDPPAGLYSLGKIPTRPCLAIVGTRSPSLYGRKMARKIAHDLSLAGFCIVSGLARGVDGESHQGALDAGGPTIAVLGSAIDVVYPPEHLGLFQRIRETGAVLSEFPLGRRADRGTFPRRNRLVAGLSHGVVVIESASSGGSMITARFAAEQGRAIFALPGRADQQEAQGCLDLIRDGATLVRNAEEIVEEILPSLPVDNLPNASDKEGRLGIRELSSLAPNEQTVIRSIEIGESFDADRLARKTGLPLAEVMAAITILEVNKWIARKPDGAYERI